MTDIAIYIKNAEAATNLHVKVFDLSLPISSDARHEIDIPAMKTSGPLPIGVKNGVSSISWTAQDLAEVRQPGAGTYDPVYDTKTYDVKAG